LFKQLLRFIVNSWRSGRGERPEGEIKRKEGRRDEAKKSASGK
jgi:hypothetical protein